MRSLVLLLSIATLSLYCRERFATTGNENICIEHRPFVTLKFGTIVHTPDVSSERDFCASCANIEIVGIGGVGFCEAY